MKLRSGKLTAITKKYTTKKKNQKSNRNKNNASDLNLNAQLPHGSMNRNNNDQQQFQEPEQPNVNQNANFQELNGEAANNVRINVEAEIANEQLIEHGPQNQSDDDSDSAQQNDNNNTQNNTIQEIHPKRKKMTDFIARPDKLKLTGNLAENWKRFKRSFDNFLVAAECNTKSDAVKIAIFLNTLGEEGNDVFDAFGLTTEQKEVYTTVIQTFENFCKPKTNEVYERFVFYQRNQKEGEPFDAFLMEIRRLVRTCEFGEMEQTMLRDRIVLGITNKRLQTKLLETNGLTYDIAVEKCRADEVTQEQTNNMSKGVAAVSEFRENANKKQQHQTNNNNSGAHNNNRQQSYGSGQNGQARNFNNNYNQNKSQNFSSNNNNSNNQNNRGNSNACRRCNRTHERRNCPAYGKICKVCSKKNHFGVVCRQKRVDTLNASDFDDNNDLYLSSVQQRVCSLDYGVRPRWKEDVGINDKHVSFKVDTGSDAEAVLPKRLFDVVAPEVELAPTQTVFRGFGGNIVKPLGVCKLRCTLNNRTEWIETTVVDTDDVPLLGFTAAIKFKLIDIRKINDYKTRQSLKHFLFNRKPQSLSNT